MKQPISMPITVNSIGTLSDGSMRLSFHTQEMNENDAAKLLGLRNEHCECLLTPYGSEKEPIYKVDADLDEKTPSKRLRGCLYVLWEKGEQKQDWEKFYKEHMEKLIQFVKGKIEKAENPL